MKIYDSPQSLVLLVNATQEDESEIGEELGIMGCRKPGLRIVGYETGSKDRLVIFVSDWRSLTLSMTPDKNCTRMED
jgi:hypothetical protein